MRISIQIDTGDEHSESHSCDSLHELEVAVVGLSHDRRKLAAALAAFRPGHHLEREREDSDMASSIPKKAIDEITKTRGVVQSATKLITNFKTILEAAVASALANGATADELQPVSDVVDGLTTDETALAAAVAANPAP